MAHELDPIKHGHGRSAGTGKYITDQETIENPDTSVVEETKKVEPETKEEKK